MSRDVKHYMVDELEEWPFTEEFKRSNVPCVSISSYVLSPEEYMGFHISDLLESLVKESDGDLEKAENGAIVFGETEKTFIREDEYPIIGRPEDDEDEIRKRNIRMFKSSVHRIFGSIMQGTLVPIKYEGEDYLFDTSNLVCVFTGDFMNNLMNIPYDLLVNCIHASCVDEVIEYIETLNSKQLGNN